MAVFRIVLALLPLLLQLRFQLQLHVQAFSLGLTSGPPSLPTAITEGTAVQPTTPPDWPAVKVRLAQSGLAVLRRGANGLKLVKQSDDDDVDNDVAAGEYALGHASHLLPSDNGAIVVARHLKALEAVGQKQTLSVIAKGEEESCDCCNDTFKQQVFLVGGRAGRRRSDINNEDDEYRQLQWLASNVGVEEETTAWLAADFKQLAHGFRCLLEDLDTASMGGGSGGGDVLRKSNRAPLKVKLERLRKANCPRFHVDKCPIRLLCTYTGKGTEWIDGDLAWTTGLVPLMSEAIESSAPLSLPSSVASWQEKVVHLLEKGGLAKLYSPHQADVLVFKGVTETSGDGVTSSMWGRRGGGGGGGVWHRSPTVTSADEPRLLLTIDLDDSDYGAAGLK